MTEHNLTITSQWARSHSGQNYTGKCSCGNWSRTKGGGLANYHRLITDEHNLHVSVENAKERPQFSGQCELCGEPYDQLAVSEPSLSDVGEFVDGNSNHVIAHAQCGIDAGLEIA